MNKKQAIDFINTLDTKHQAAQPLLRAMVRGDKVTAEHIDKLDSRFVNLAPILRSIAGGKANKETSAQIERLDTFGAPLRPLLTALAAGLKD